MCVYKCNSKTQLFLVARVEFTNNWNGKLQCERHLYVPGCVAYCFLGNISATSDCLEVV